jgi:hypothetical protein
MRFNKLNKKLKLHQKNLKILGGSFLRIICSPTTPLSTRIELVRHSFLQEIEGRTDGNFEQSARANNDPP